MQDDQGITSDHIYDPVAALEARIASHESTDHDTVTEGEATEPTVTRDPKSGLTLIGAQNNREFPIRNLKLLADAKKATLDARTAEAELTATALTLFGLVATASALFKKAQDTELEAKRLMHRLIADTDGRVKDEEVRGFDFDRAVIILKPVAPET